MKVLIIAILFSLNASATNYFVSNTGSNVANGLTAGTAWQTISKVNSSSFASGDSIFFKCGDTWRERLNVPTSGLYFGSYITGAKPIITGLETITMTNAGSNIWTANVPNAVPKLNTVLINGLIRAKARTPNTGYSTFSGYSGNNKIVVTGSGAFNHLGKEISVRSAHWVIDVTKVIQQIGDTLVLFPALTYTPSLGGNGYFFQNVESTLDVVGEWYFDSTNKIIKVYATSTPTVQISTIDTLIYLSSKNNITFNGIEFSGANIFGVQADTSNYLSVKNCVLNYSLNGIRAAKSNYANISNNSFNHNLSNAIMLVKKGIIADSCNNSLVYENTIRNSGVLPGMGVSGNQEYNGIYIIGHNNIIVNNTIDSTGYIPISFLGQKDTVYKNFISNHCFVKDDGSGIYTVVGLSSVLNDSSVIRRNIVINGIGASAGTSSSSWAAGIYTDDFSRRITIDSNTIYGAFGSAFYLHSSTQIWVYNNNVIDSIGYPFYALGSNSYLTGLDIKRNVFYSLNSSFFTVKREGGTSFNALDSNLYFRPPAPTTQFDLAGSTTSLSGWQTATSQDANSIIIPSGVTSATPLFYYNATQADSTITLLGTYYEMKGVSAIHHTNSITLKPFTSAVLYKATTDDATLKVRVKLVRNI